VRIAILMFGLLTAAPAVAADQFDLVCKGGKETVRYRVDLKAGEWCFGACGRVMKIAEVTEGTITLFDDEPSAVDRTRSYDRIDRRTGAWEWYNYSPALSIRAMNITGTCEPAPFSGFGLPTRKF